MSESSSPISLGRCDVSSSPINSSLCNSKRSNNVYPKSLFVGNLWYKVNEASLRRLFQKFGTVADIVIMRNHRQVFGFVQFHAAASVDLCLNQHLREPLVCDNRVLEIKRRVKKGPKSSCEIVVENFDKRCIREADLWDYFKQFGPVVHIALFPCTSSGSLESSTTTSACVTFQAPRYVLNVLSQCQHSIKHQSLCVKRPVAALADSSKEERVGLEERVALDRFVPFIESESQPFFSYFQDCLF